MNIQNEYARKIFEKIGHRLVPLTKVYVSNIGYAMYNDHAIELTYIEGFHEPVGVCVAKDGKVLSEHSVLFQTVKEALEYCKKVLK